MPGSSATRLTSSLKPFRAINLFVHYDDGGDEQTYVNYCRKINTVPRSAAKFPQATPPSSNYYAVVNRVLGHWTDGFWYPARIQSVNRDGYSIAFDGGCSASALYADRIMPLNWNVRTPVQCNWHGAGKFYLSAITGMNGTN